MIFNLLRRINNYVLLEFNTIYDYVKFKKNFTKLKNANNDKTKLSCWILQDKHRIEKAFTLPNPRFGFGKDVIERISKNLNIYKSKYGVDNIYQIGISALFSYKEFHQDNNKEVPDFYTLNIKQLDKQDISIIEKKAGYYIPEKLDEISLKAFKKFAQSRHSCRNFQKNKEITDSVIRDIIEISITAPSVCNRQHWRIHFFTGDKMEKILSFQNGNSGFTENIPMIAVITSDIRAFYTPNERNQPYIDGGIFAMNVMYAIHSVGLESCPLNWCNSYKQEINFDKLNLIEKNERIILILAMGYSTDSALYAKSPRLPIDNFYKLHK
ncbi:hypothetical protein GWI78_15950 [Proteus sp. G2658]|uniref:Nitroreductase domain-containing protein n=1 Tax=Proteus penneri TaxID=102862 RepID=A0A385JNW4_9GAMM|nr:MULTISPECIES: nitroreductase family protein [Proteus]AXY99986.1 hypothetical protein [Proteus penneri]NBM91391.1 hypothetical protein [Proteus sp. G2658]